MKLPVAAGCVSLAFTAGIADVHAAKKGSAEQKRPNILFCVADDAGHFGAYGCRWVNTPNFDSVARKGVLFDNAFTCNSKSAPSRACMITGRNSWQLEEAANHWCNFPQKFVSFPEALKKSGYETGYTGKGWGPGVAVNADGSNRKLTGKPYNKIRYTPPTPEMSPINYSANFDAFLAERDKSKPFCFWYGAREPHRGYEFQSSLKKGGKKISDIDSVPSYWPDNDVVRTDMLDYALEIEQFDNHLGKILASLDSIGELDNTIVIVTSDHGMPFPRVKGQDYYYSNHIPMAVMWGNELKNPGRRSGELISVIDFAPTLLEIAGVDGEKYGMQPIEGHSFMDVLNDKVDSAVDRSVMMMGKERHDVGRPDDEGYPMRSMLKGKYLYIHNYEPTRWPAGDPVTGYMNIDGSPTKTEILKARHTPETKYFWDLSMGKRGDKELYDVSVDPLCMVNLADREEYKGVVNDMETEMSARLSAQGDPRMKGEGAIFDKYPNMSKSHDYYNRMKAGEQIPFNWINASDFDPEMQDAE
ncbi:MAG: sulfatase [Muribaculaceae bacterium]|nr:sulfatase [Muribaculaceae bacterium]